MDFNTNNSYKYICFRHKLFSKQLLPESQLIPLKSFSLSYPVYVTHQAHIWSISKINHQSTDIQIRHPIPA